MIIIELQKQLNQNIIVDRAPEQTGVFRKEKIAQPLAVLTALGAFALAAPAKSSQEAATSLQGVGFSTNRVWVNNRAEAQVEAERITAVGSNTLRIANPYTRGGASVDNDAQRLCNTAQVAAENHLDLVISMEGRYKDGELGYIPTTAGEKQRYLTALVNMIHTLYGENGCADKPSSLSISLFNEPNNPLFLRNQYVNGEWVAPKQVVALYQYAYGRLHQEAETLGLNFRVVAGELRQRGARRFLQRMAEIIKEQKIEKWTDALSIHYYANGADADTSQSADEYLKQMSSLLDDKFGLVEKWVTEVGGISEIPPRLKYRYTKKKAPNIKPLSAKEQGKFYSDFIKNATCRKFARVLIFHYEDDGTILSTGLKYKKGKPKASLPVVQQTFADALTGNVDCSKVLK